MRSTKELLERARRAAPSVTFDLTDFERRRQRRVSRRRISAAIVALTLAAVSFGAAFVALRQSGEGVIGSSGPVKTLPPATDAPLVAAPGQFYYRAVLLVACFPDGEGACDAPATRLDASFWWRDDDAGRIVVDDVQGYGIDAGRFEPGEFPNPNGIDVSTFPLDTTALTEFLLERSAENGASPAPLVTPLPEGAPNDGQLWRAITDLLQDPHVTPAVRASLLDVAAGLQGSHIETNVLDPADRPAHLIEFGNWGGQVPERLYVDPQTHELLAWTVSSMVDEASFTVFIVQDAGVVGSTETGPQPGDGSVPLTLLSTEDLGAAFIDER